MIFTSQRIRMQHTDNPGFNKTETIVALSQLGGDRYISRSQAKKIVRSLEKFEIIVFDFDQVQTVGQGFVDEVFRVFQNQYPKLLLKYINANPEVEFMIKRSLPKNN